MATCKTSVLNAINMMQEGIDSEIERIILAKLKENAAPMLEKMAADIAKGLKANIMSYNRIMENDVIVVLKLDGIEALRV